METTILAILAAAAIADGGAQYSNFPNFDPVRQVYEITIDAPPADIIERSIEWASATCRETPKRTEDGIEVGKCRGLMNPPIANYGAIYSEFKYNATVHCEAGACLFRMHHIETGSYVLLVPLTEYGFMNRRKDGDPKAMAKRNVIIGSVAGAAEAYRAAVAAVP